MSSALDSSYAYCRRACRRASSSFPAAFAVLPRPKRRAMSALYAFFRLSDDLADGPGEVADKRRLLAEWRTRTHDAITSGRHTHRLHAALAHTVTSYDVPLQYLDDVLDGVTTDLEPVRYKSFAELYPYCYRVASAVGLACLPVWGFGAGHTLASSSKAAESAGVAFQLTNILRDVAEDQGRGRVYLPEDDLAQFGLTPADWHTPKARPAFRAMMHFQAVRARGYYERAAELEGFLSREGRAIYRLLSGLYRGLLDRIEAARFDVFARRISLGTGAKVRLLAGAWPARWGLT